ncbi:MAG: PEP-CTERM sorting domain-containing protein [Sulfuritalea sp.]|nr:PEP-CTERM sorting domain-containing protein [Sulfuritalea sp.]
MKSKLLNATSTALLAALCGAGSVHAAAPPGQLDHGLIDIRYQNTYAGVTTQLHLPLAAGPGGLSVGIYDFQRRNAETLAPEGSFLAYCVDPWQWASSNYHTYETRLLSASPLAHDAARYANVVRLFGHAYADSLGDQIKAAGFQLALWEAFNDDGDLYNGAVRVTSGTHGAVTGAAQSLLGQLDTWGAAPTTYELTLFSNSGYQDYLAVTATFASAAPEPGSYAMLLAGLGLLTWVVRRRNKA